MNGNIKNFNREMSHSKRKKEPSGNYRNKKNLKFKILLIELLSGISSSPRLDGRQFGNPRNISFSSAAH
jgi:hypothetical protein